MVTSICKWGNSQGIRIPIGFLNATGISVDDKVEITSKDDTIVIKKIDKKVTFDSLFANYQGEPAPEYDWGDPVGLEVW